MSATETDVVADAELTPPQPVAAAMETPGDDPSAAHSLPTGVDEAGPEALVEDESEGPVPLYVGRDAQIAEAAEALLAGSSIVVRGKPGIGKRAFLRQVRGRLADQGGKVCLWPNVSTAKTMGFDLCEQVHEAIGLQVPESLIPPRFRASARRTGTVPFRHIRRAVNRMTAADQLNLALATLANVERKRVVLFVESLELPPTQADMLHQLAEYVQIAATHEEHNKRNRIMRLLWRFERQIELKALPRAEVRRWVEAWLERHPIHFAKPKLREAFVSAVCRDAGGVPAAVEGMLAAAAAEPEVSRRTVREMTHEAAVQYLDMTPLLIITAAGFMALRYISRGMGMQELMVMAGVGTSLFWVILYFARMMQAKR
ncbi:hypothetical protein CKO31_18245 [Thiohalocapsa halophila]|uniref:ATP-binding protein n=1 Tax=Thiohalocapsa halophila TaxID=69359 RepID=A0ABS1CL34_9GAMM|nr:ATP-binding protein [Thiohalocapsa halophila]MBK1632647.1 hypothetical protein [Thiohalocapsa halophila]